MDDTVHPAQQRSAVSGSAINIPGFDPAKYGHPVCLKRPAEDISGAATAPSSQEESPQPRFEEPKPACHVPGGFNENGSVQQMRQGGRAQQDHGEPVSAAKHTGRGRNELSHRGPASKGDAARPADLPRKDETANQVLARVQEAQMRQIGSRNRHKGQDVTISLRDLEIARTPVGQYQTPESTSRSALHSKATLRLPPASVQTSPQNPSGVHSGKLGSQDAPLLGAVGLRKSHARRTTKGDLKPVSDDKDSYAWGSATASNAPTAPNDSTKAMHQGKTFRKIELAGARSALVGWDGKIQPPPVDWNDRPRFDNDMLAFKSEFNNWAEATKQLHFSDAGELQFGRVSVDRLLDLNLHPDGIDMVSRGFSLNANNAHNYGYHTDVAEITRFCRPVEMKDFNDDSAKLDTELPENARIMHERPEQLIRNWNAHRNIRRDLVCEVTESAPKVQQLSKEYKSEPNPHRPIINIFLRPALETDLSQVTSIYNWHVEHGPRTAEFTAISEIDMRTRFENVTSAKLPFLVAVHRSAKGATHHETTSAAGSWGAVPNPNSYPGHRDVVRHEKIVGWACAQDFTAPDFIERISAELEVYVDPAFRQQGVGRCLLDKLLDVCDRGYVKRGGYVFRCEAGDEYLFGPGGGRDLHKLLFVVRTWQYPKAAVPAKFIAGHGRKDSRAAQIHAVDGDDEWERWLKKWLESWGFDCQGVLTGIGTKHGRFLNVIYLARETKWQPAEGHIPEYVPGLS